MAAVFMEDDEMKRLLPDKIPQILIVSYRFTGGHNFNSAG